MNYYNKGGQAHGLKSLAQELPKYGRGGDSIVAHINPEEAMMLKAMGGSGTINPQTGLPEYFKIGNVFKPIQRAIGQLNPLNPSPQYFSGASSACVYIASYQRGSYRSF
jgi:hypothetical protein